jgi:hypothetical protein
MKEILAELNEIIDDLEENELYTEASELHDAFIKISEKQTRREKELGHKTPPKGYPDSKKQYADPANFKYPLDSEAHVMAAWKYINMPRNQKMYSPSKVSSMKARIRKIAKEKYGKTLKEGGD